MKIINVVQGDKQWHAHRAKFRNASETPIVMGVSSKRKRQTLIKERATGLCEEVDEYAQARYNKGHQYEALARPVAEDIIGEALSPLVGVSGEYSASFDGLTFDMDISFEHKWLNQELISVLSIPGVSGTDLPLEYQVQMEHQMMVSGAEKALFMATKWNDAGEMIDCMYCWYLPNPELRAQIGPAWDQFEKDVAAYKPQEEVVEVVADIVVNLPSLFIQATGEIAIKSNLQLFGSKLRDFVAGINLEPSTDLDFANADEACKIMQNAENALVAAESNAMAQAAGIDEVRSTVAALKKVARDTRLMLEKLVVKRKETIKLVAINKARDEFIEHVAELQTEIGGVIRLQVESPDFALAIKGKRNMSSVNSALANALAAGKIKADATAKDVRVKIAALAGTESYAFLLPDMQQLIAKPFDDFVLAVTTRIEKHKADDAAKLEAQRYLIQADEEAKARAKVEADNLRTQYVPPVNLAEDLAAPHTPTRSEVIMIVADKWGMSDNAAHAWLRSEFSKVEE